MTADPAAELLARLRAEATASGYSINPDGEFALALAEGLETNRARYGYAACPCRLASGDRSADLDIVCPCDYRDADIEEYGACFCALYVNRDIAEGRSQARSVPERRPPGGPKRSDAQLQEAAAPAPTLAFPVWRCKVCGYLCARPEPPGTCPICKVTKDRFERFM
jgi:ferredoxin-thioredoxin reductase catalytic chain